MSEAGRPERTHKQRVAAMAGTFALVVVVLAPAAASWHGLTATARDWLGLAGWWVYLPPLVLDAAALYAATLALRSTLAGDSALVDRGLVWVYAAMSSGLNVWHADAATGRPAALFYGLASLSAVVLWDRTLRAIRRSELRAIGAVDAPPPRFRTLRWLLHTRETARAVRAAVGAGVSTPAEALALVGRDHRTAASVTKTGEESKPALTLLPREAVRGGNRAAHSGRRPARSAEQAVAAERAPELAGMTQAQGLAHAAEVLGTSDVPTLRAWLAERGMKTDKSTAYKTMRRMQEEQGNSAGEDVA